MPVPSQFLHAPRAMARSGGGWSAAAYGRALESDVLALAGCLDAAAALPMPDPALRPDVLTISGEGWGACVRLTYGDRSATALDAVTTLADLDEARADGALALLWLKSTD
jgi:hypothetical protein